ncbi:Uncharacterized membrane protein YphA, DoxX/SURF4 family [Alteribacillus persepolensis]|uniref:Uncharacterized membrane protein YphA, DoxX/SURF4 family n=1 Tax=Alteribacillus persepolensis TaxID=568899 RepID=A0A1G8JZW8_9BACI|nr:DoxX family protein [Alteribacillus persepolensis]SDI36647.1 Uncharacterized membrane protein YphA, DoxX/SURF4 family [Alteribacillus persepolensis]
MVDMVTMIVQGILLVLRCLLGGVMFASGIEKLWTVSEFHAVFDASVLPGFLVHPTAIIETLAGLMLVFGMFVRISAFSLIVPIIAALFVIPYHDGWFLSSYTQAFILLIAAVILVGIRRHPFSLPDLSVLKDQSM